MGSMNRCARASHRTAWMIACILGVTLAASGAALAQGDRSDRSQRDHDRTGREDRSRRDEGRIGFTHSTEGRHFDNGVTLRKGTYFTDRHMDAFFPHHYYSYPHYAVSRAAVGVSVVISPFHFYYGVFPPYITRADVVIAPPPHVFIEVPIYVNNVYRGYPDVPVVQPGYYLDRRSEDDRWKDNPTLRRAVYDLEDAFRDNDITLLTSLTDPGTKIAIFAQGHYDYSIEPSDYLDMTRDFMRTAHTTDFVAYRVRRRTSGVYQVFAKHTYRGQDDQTHVVYVCVVLERAGDRWTITQIDTSPDRLEN